MTRVDKAALRKSVREGACEAVWRALLDSSHSSADMWEDNTVSGCPTWEGDEVVEVCREVYEQVCKALKVRGKVTR